MQEQVCITGSNGFIGKHLCNYMLDKGYPIYGIDKQDRYKTNTRDFFFGNLSDTKQLPFLRKCFENWKLKTVFHLAAESSVQKSYNNPFIPFDNNARATLLLLEACRLSGVENFIFSSSAAVYDNNSPYGLSKKICEDIVNYYNINHGINTCILRYFNVYGENMNNESVISNFLERKSKSSPLTVHGDGYQKRDFVYVKDVCNANYLAWKNIEKISKPLDIGTGEETTINEIAKTLSNTIIHTKDYPGVSESKCSNVCARNILGWYPTGNVLDWLINV